MHFKLLCFIFFILTNHNVLSAYNSYNKINYPDCGYKGPALYGVYGTGSQNKSGFTVAGPHEFRWQVIIQLTTNMVTRANWCSGTLINSQWVLTAAHCTTNMNNGQDLKPSLLTVVAGVYDLAKKGDTSEGSRQVRKAVFTERNMFVHWAEGHDYSLIKVDKPFEMGGSATQVSAICLPNNETVKGPIYKAFMGKDCIATGWRDQTPGRSIT